MEPAPLRDYKCPFCGHETEMKLYDVFDGYRFPNGKTMLLSDMMVEYVCPQCRERLYNNMVYHDMKKEFCVIFATEPSFYEIALNSVYHNGTDFSGLDRYTGYENVRIVRDHQEMKEKLWIFDSGLNDIYCEILKQKKCYDFSDKANYWSFMKKTDENGNEILGFYPVIDHAVQNLPVTFELDEYYQTVREYEDRVSKIRNVYEEIPELAIRIVNDMPYGDITAPLSAGQTYMFSRSMLAREIYKFIDPDNDFSDRDSAMITRQDVEAISQSWQDCLEELRKAWYWNSQKKPTVRELGGPLLEELIYSMNYYLTAFDPRNPESRQMMAWLLDNCEFSHDRRTLHEFKRLLFRTLNDELKERYMDSWVADEPDNAYVRGQQIYYYYNRGKMDKAKQLADEYLHMTIHYRDDYWLYRACEAVYRFYGLQEKADEVRAIRSEVDDEVLV